MEYIQKLAKESLKLEREKMQEKYDKIDLENRKSFNKIRDLQDEKFEANEMVKKLQKQLKTQQQRYEDSIFDLKRDKQSLVNQLAIEKFEHSSLTSQLSECRINELLKPIRNFLQDKDVGIRKVKDHLKTADFSPLFKLGDEVAGKIEGTDCAICLLEFDESKQDFTKLGCCSQRLHQKCLQDCLKQSEDCPLCRQKVM